MSTSHLAFIDTRMPRWLKAATPAQRQQLEQVVRDSHRATRHVQRVLAQVQPIEAFCRPLLDDAMGHWFDDRELPTVEKGWLRTSRDKGGQSWLEAALQNFDSDAQVELYFSSTDQAPMQLDSTRFVKGVRNLDLGQRYRNHLCDHVATADFHRLLREQDRAAFAADTLHAQLQGYIDAHGRALADAALAGDRFLLDEEGKPAPLACSYLTLFEIPLNGPLLIRREPLEDIEPCLLYLPGHPRQPLRQYPSLKAAGKALTRLLWKDSERAFFSRYTSHTQRPALAFRLRKTLYPYYPYASVQTIPPVIEEGDTFSWLKRMFPSPRDLWQATLDKNARLPLAATRWSDDCFTARARIQVQRMLADAAAIAVPVAQRDAAAQLEHLEQWLSVGLSVLNVAGFFVPGLGELMLVVGGAQLVDEFLEGVHAANEGDADAAIGHLFEVFENLAQVAALGAAVHFSLPEGALHDWHRIGHGDEQRLWHGGLEPFARPRPTQAAPRDGLYVWRSRQWLAREGHSYPVEPAPDGQWRLARAAGHRHQPMLRGTMEGPWVLDHERPLSWSRNQLLRRLGPAAADLDTSALAQALRCSGYDDATLRQVFTDRLPLPALLLDSLEAFGADHAVPAGRPGEALLMRDFPALGRHARREILDRAQSRDLRALQRTGRLPLSLSETARLYLREARINRALVGFYRANGAMADRDMLVLAALQRLSGWTGEIHLQLHAERFNGQLLGGTGQAGTSTRTLVRLDSGYQPLDQNAEALSGPTNLFQAILQALPDSERDALGINIHEPDALRDRLLERLTEDRQQAARDLGLSPVRPMYRLPTRLPGDQRIGYRLSGRGQGLQTPDEMFDQLFPANLDNDRENLRTRLRQQAGNDPVAFSQLMHELQQQYRQLDGALQAWVQDTQAVAADRVEQQRAARQALAERVRQAWRRENNHPNGGLDQVRLSLDGEHVGALPTLGVQLPYVHQLTITGLWRAGNESLGAFLTAFPEVRELELTENGLTLLPTQLGELEQLRSLDLSENNLDMNSESNLAILCRLTRLHALNLTAAVADLPATALERLAQLTQLRALQAEMNELLFEEQHFRALQRWPALEELSLGQNDITLTPASRAALAGLDRLRILFLHDNPLDLEPDLTGWTHLQRLDLECTGIAHWPVGLPELMNQQPLVLRAVDLSNNQLHDAPALQHTTFAAAIRAGEAGMYHSFQSNPFDALALQRLNDAGLPTAPQANVLGWLTDFPEPLRAHISDTFEAPEWQPLYDLFHRLEDTQDYHNSPGTMRRRMQTILEQLTAREQAVGNERWGQAQVQEHVIGLINEAAQGCVDQATLLFQQVETEVLVWQQVLQAAPDEASESMAVVIVSSLLRQRLLDERIGKVYDARVARRRALLEGTAADEAPPLQAEDDISDAQLSEPTFLLDELEMALHARMRLLQRLGLPPQPSEISFDYLARLSPATLERLAQGIEAQATAQAIVQWAGEQPFWQAWLQRLHPEDFRRLGDAWNGASVYFDALSEAGEVSAYEGPAVPDAFIEALQRERPDVPWRRDGILQRIDLVSNRYRNEDALYRRAGELLLATRHEADAALLRQLTEAMAEAYLPRQ
ncbi:dermonecrotic toxin domain-containing protein [Pseudomonas guariconensis]|uniref:dermonecrotic toxin domain-containing protein n=1 Tax=Pseudomonas guariconensis TaxID=1288410 RepID=UPI0018A98D6A|nr:DUF6543 domain-containing protein [Pseudomonas guariconensis]MBF8740867.1 hypothetical protein [Pseudomonas guariconensis]MBF8750461.1 hypothetical protein [Pseudomonas guariconensis]